jgi:hypothetical protein
LNQSRVATEPATSPALPAVPTIAEAGLSSCIYTPWYGIRAPARTPAQFGDLVRSDLAKWTKIIRDAGIKAQQAAPRLSGPPLPPILMRPGSA